MGITVRYRGTVDRMEEIEELEDRAIDLVFALGGQATVWRSFADRDSSRIIRGLMIEMAPGQETMSLLVSPEGHLINLFEIEDAEKHPIALPPECFVKTQFGNVYGHVAIIYLLDALKTTYISTLEVDDESGFYVHRDPQRLATSMKQLDDVIRRMGDSLREYGLSEEAAEDPSILMPRIERIAQLVAQKLNTPVSSPLIRDDSDTSEVLDDEPSLEVQVDEQMRDYRRRMLRSERMTRRMREQQALGNDISESIQKALRDEGLGSTNHESDGTDEEFWQDRDKDTDGPWQESLGEISFVEKDDEEQDGFFEHPAINCVKGCLIELMEVGALSEKPSPFFRVAMNGLMDVMGGIVQATALRCSDRGNRAYAIVQLRRAIKGLAFFRGAVFGLASDESIDSDFAKSMHSEHAVLLESLHELLTQAWEESSSNE